MLLKVNEENQDKAEKSEFPQHLSRANTHYLKENKLTKYQKKAKTSPASFSIASQNASAEGGI